MEITAFLSHISCTTPVVHFILQSFLYFIDSPIYLLYRIYSATFILFLPVTSPPLRHNLRPTTAEDSSICLLIVGIFFTHWPPIFLGSKWWSRLRNARQFLPQHIYSSFYLNSRIYSSNSGPLAAKLLGSRTISFFSFKAALIVFQSNFFFKNLLASCVYFNSLSFAKPLPCLFKSLFSKDQFLF